MKIESDEDPLIAGLCDGLLVSAQTQRVHQSVFEEMVFGMKTHRRLAKVEAVYLPARIRFLAYDALLIAEHALFDAGQSALFSRTNDFYELNLEGLIPLLERVQEELLAHGVESRMGATPMAIGPKDFFIVYDQRAFSAANILGAVLRLWELCQQGVEQAYEIGRQMGVLMEMRVTPWEDRARLIRQVSRLKTPYFKQEHLVMRVEP